MEGITIITNIDGFIESLFKFNDRTGVASSTALLNEDRKDNMYCPTCGGERRMDINPLHAPKFIDAEGKPKPVTLSDFKQLKGFVKAYLISSLWIYKCTQCDTFFTVTFYKGPNGISMAILPSCNGGVVTPNTPPPISYYLDQAAKAKAIGANSACMAMYRAALDQLLFEQGFQEGMLGNKLKELQKAIDNGSASKWAKELDINYLSYLNQLGSGSIHTNDGDVQKQKELDSELMELVEIVFAMLLDKIYEQPKREEGWLKALQDKTKHFEWKGNGKKA